MYECFHCLQRTVVWDADFTFDDYGIEGEGLINHCHCTNCGAEIDYFVPITEEDKTELKERYGDHGMEKNFILESHFESELFNLLAPKKLTRETWDTVNEIIRVLEREPKIAIDVPDELRESVGIKEIKEYHFTIDPPCEEKKDE